MKPAVPYRVLLSNPTYSIYYINHPAGIVQIRILISEEENPGSSGAGIVQAVSGGVYVVIRMAKMNIDSASSLPCS